MPAYSGAGTYPYWIEVIGNGTVSGPTMISENIPVTPGTEYTFSAVAAYDSTYSSGMGISISWYEAGGTYISDVTANQGSMTGGTQYILATAQTAAPSNAAYAVAKVTSAGTPATGNPLQVYRAEFNDQYGNSVNINYAFTYSYYPWTADTTTTTLTWNYAPNLPEAFDSLVIDDVIELMGGPMGSPCNSIPELLDSNGVGPTFRIMAPPALNSEAYGYESSYDLNAPQPTQDVVASMLLDGERPFGTRASNRQMSLPVLIFGSSFWNGTGGMDQVYAAREYLMAVIDQQVFQMRWTPADTGLPMLFDCFRALPSVPLYGFNYSEGGSPSDSAYGRPNAPMALITLTIQALPYGRSDIDGQQNLALANPLVDGPVAPSTGNYIDTFTAGASLQPGFIPDLSFSSALYGYANGSGTTLTGIVETNLVSPVAVPAGAASIVTVSVPAATTITITDSANNTYNQIASKTNSTTTNTTYVFAAFNCQVITSSDTLTFTQTTNQAYTIGAMTGIGLTGVTTVATNSGASTAPSVTAPVQTFYGTCDFIVFSNTGANTSAGPTNATQASPNLGTNPYTNCYWAMSGVLSGTTYTGTYAASQNWDAIGITFSVAATTAPVQVGGLTQSGQTVNVVTPAVSIPAHTGLIVNLLVGNVATETVHVTDTQGHVYTLQENVQNSSGPVQQFTFSTITQHTMTPLSDTITVTSSSTDFKNITIYALPGVSAITASSNSGTSTAPSVACPASGQANSTSIGIFGNNSTAVATPVTNWTQLPSQTFGSEHTDAFWQPDANPGNTSTVTSAYAASESWVATGLTLSIAPGAYWNLDTTTKTPNGIGASVHYQAPRPMHMPWPPAAYNATLQQPVSIVGLPALSVWFGQSYDTQWPMSTKFVSNVTLDWTLFDIEGQKLNFSHTYKKCPWGDKPATPKWTLITSAIPQGRSFDYGNVTGFSVIVSNWSGSGATGYVRMHCWLNEITANPQTISNATSPRGWVYNMFSLPGTARTPISVQAQLPQEVPQTIELTQESGTWTVPAGVYSVQAECWGAGGAGASVSGSSYTPGGGGGGGEYAQEPALNVLPGQQIPYSIGQGGTPAQLVDTVVQFTNPAKAHWTCPPGVTTVFVECWGAGAAGAAGGGGGGGGGYASSNITVKPGTTYYIQPGAGGKADTGTSASQNAGRDGGHSWFGTASTTGPANSLVAADGGSSPTTGGSNGGQEGFARISFWPQPNVAAFRGGTGGTSPGQAGGGGAGAGGATGAGSPGGNSPAAVQGAGRYTQGGAGGSGNGQGGAGGAGANAPGYPSPGAIPGGGGGGGYSGPPINPKTTPGNSQVNYIGGNGGDGMVQLSYAVGNGSPVAGGTTTFGSGTTTGTVVKAHGGGSATTNNPVGAAGGSGSSNTIHFNGGDGGLNYGDPTGGSWMAIPRTTSIFTTLATMTYDSTTDTSGASAASVAQGVAVALIETTAPVSDLYVTDSVGNVYNNVAQQAGGSGGTGVTIYAYVADLQYPITTSTTLTVTSATSQETGVIWYASPWLLSGVDTANLGSANGTGTAASVQFDVNDQTTVQYELVVMANSSTEAWTQTTYANQAWYAASSTSTLTAGSLVMNAWMGINQGGGTGTAGTGDVLNATVSSSAAWSALAIPFVAYNQQGAMCTMAVESGSTPGASTSWTNAISIINNGVILVVGMNASGSTAAPSAVVDVSGNSYSFSKTAAITGNGNGNMWAYAAEVTAALPQGATGAIHWGAASAAANYAYGVYWLPNVTTEDASLWVNQGNSTAASGSVSTTVANDLLIGVVGSVTNSLVASTPTSWDYMGILFDVPAAFAVYAQQTGVAGAKSFSTTLSLSEPWGVGILSFKQSFGSYGGGAAGGPNQAGYIAPPDGIGAPGYSGGGRGGNGTAQNGTGGGGAAFPGGGGGGALTDNNGAQAGGQGGNGLIKVTWQPPLQPFNTLIIHRPGDDAPQTLSPMVPIPLTDTPTNIEYTVPSLVTNLNADFLGTYSVLLCNNSWNASGNVRTVTVTVNQYEYPGGPRYSVAVTKSFIPATDIVNGIVSMGEVSLPIKDYAQHNDESYFTVAISDTNTNDVFQDILFLDTTGQTYLINIGPGTPGESTYTNFYIDEPTPDRDLGFVGASINDRKYQVSVLDYCQVAGGPLYILGNGQDNTLLAYSPSGAPDLGVTYSPRWYLNRSQ